LNGFDAMHASFRLALQQLGRFIRDASVGRVGAAGLKRTEKQLRQDYLVTTEKAFAACDHCGADNEVMKGASAHRCGECGKNFNLEW
jgi:hypothetical protein